MITHTSVQALGQARLADLHDQARRDALVRAARRARSGRAGHARRCGWRLPRRPAVSSLQVLRLITAGRSDQRIAHDLVVALNTVNNHVTYVLGKLGAANWTEAAARARQLGLIP